MKSAAWFVAGALVASAVWALLLLEGQNKLFCIILSSGC